MWWAEAPTATPVAGMGTVAVSVAAAMASDLEISRAATGDSLISTTIVTGQADQLAEAGRAHMPEQVLVAPDCQWAARAWTMAGHTIVIQTLGPTSMVWI